MKNFRKILYGIITFVMIFFVLTTIHAQSPLDKYTTLVSLPGINDTPEFKDYIIGIFNLSIGIGAVLAFVMITFGGIMYSTSDAISGRSAGREYVTNAIIGLFFVIGAWVILNTINPQILTFNLAIPTAPVKAGTPTVVTPNPCCQRPGGILAGYTLTPAEVAENTRLVKLLHDNGVEVNNGPCTTGGTQGCTNIVGFPAEIPPRLIALKTSCVSSYGSNCLITVTGGTEGGHKTHGPGLPVFDLAPTTSLNAYFSTINKEAARPLSGTRVALPSGGTATYENTGDNGRATAPHWHVQYQ